MLLFLIAVVQPKQNAAKNFVEDLTLLEIGCTAIEEVPLKIVQDHMPLRILSTKVPLICF